jgi:DNA-binding LytR/AlgR family response regulator
MRLVSDEEKEKKRTQVAICGDLDANRILLYSALQRFFWQRGEEVEITEYCYGETMVQDVQEGYEDFHLIFLDMDQKDKSGLEIARSVRRIGRSHPLIVFFSQTVEYAIEGYEIEASGYLLKPVDERKLHNMLERLLKPSDRPQIAVRCQGRMRYFFIDEIAWIESNKHMVFFHFQNGTTERTNDKLSNIEARLNDRRFLRCHQSYLVNMDCVVDVGDGFIMKDESQVPIRVRSRKSMVETFHRYFMSHGERRGDVYA